MNLEDVYLKDLLARLDGNSSAAQGYSAPEPGETAAVATVVATSVAVEEFEPAETPVESAPRPDRAAAEAALNERLAQLRQQLAASTGSPTPPSGPARTERLSTDAAAGDPTNSAAPFVPAAPNSLQDLGLRQEEVEAIAIKFLLNRGVAAGRQIAEQLGIPFSLAEMLLYSLKTDQVVVQKGAAALGDYTYQLTPQGIEDARRALVASTYCDTVPVPLEDYIASVEAQSIRRVQPTSQGLECVFEDLLVEDELRHQIGQAVHAGKGFFLYGAPGNGKTSLAERVARAFGQFIWIPRAIGIAGEIVRLYDPCNHQAVPPDYSEAQLTGPVDRRWVRIRRPTVIAGGELTMDRLEIATNSRTHVSEAPLQLKSNCGVLVIDDFGRQRMGVAELLNRWIVPLDRGYDFLNLPSGKTIQVPFDQLLVFSTNLEPRELVDEAFLRRISYKIEVPDPTLDGFRKLLAQYAGKLEMPYNADVVEYLIRQHYVAPQRPVRACHARDLLEHVRSYCGYRRQPLAMSQAAFDAAVKNYFGLMGDVAG